MNCLVCNHTLCNAVEEWENSTEAEIADGASVAEMVSQHTLWECKECKTLHVYCDACKTYAQLVSRSLVMDSNDNSDVFAWRDQSGNYHSTSLRKELSKKYDIPLSVTVPDAWTKILQEKLCINNEQAETLYIELCDDHVNEFGADLGFNLEDLNVYCLDPNDMQLIHLDESGIAYYGTGYNIMERSWVEWRCKCSTSVIAGHDD